MPHPLRIAFMGTPEFSTLALQALIDSAHEVVCVYSQPPRPKGRGQQVQKSPVHVLAEAHDIEVRTPVNFKDANDVQAFKDLNLDVAIVAAYGLILPQNILDAPHHGCINIHASILPRWRGAAPIHRAIMAGDARTGVCIMQMEAGLDTGPVLLREVLDIGAEETTAQLHDRLSALGARAVVEALAHLDTLVPEAQPEVGVTYAAKIDKAEARIDWTQPAVEVDRQIRGLSPFPGAWFEHDGARIKVLGAQLVEGSGPVGMVLDARLHVACGEGAVALTRLQKAGKGAQDAAAFQRGAQVAVGTDLSKD